MELERHLRRTVHLRDTGGKAKPSPVKWGGVDKCSGVHGDNCIEAHMPVAMN